MPSFDSSLFASVVLGSVLAVPAAAQMTQAWVRAAEGQPQRLLRAADGDLIVAASMVVPSNIGGAAFYDSNIARYAPDGALRWRWQSNEAPIDRLSDIALDAQGNIYAVGEYGTSFWGQAPFATRLMKFSSTGQRLWTANYTPSRAGFDAPPEGVRVAPDGSVYIFGQDPGQTTQRDIYIARYTSAGVHQWTFRRAGPVWDFVFDLAFDGASNAYWVGSTFRPNTTLNGACLGKLLPSGQQEWIWLQPVGNNAGGALSRISVDQAGELVATGHAEYFPGYQDGMLLKVAPQGQQRFFELWNGPYGAWDRFFTHAILSDNSIVVSGDTYAGDGAEYYDVPTVRFSPDGQPQWADIYGSTLYYPNDTEEWSLNMFALPGDEVLTISTDWARPGYDFALHRHRPDGSLVERTVNELSSGDIKDIPTGCAVHDASRNALYLLGWGSGFPGNPIADHYALIRVDLPASTPICRADFNGVGGVSVQDLFDFLSAFFLGDVRADFNGANGVTVQDLFDFLSAWFAGC